MIKKSILFLVLFSLCFALSCNNKTSNTKTSNAKTAANADVKRGVEPVPDAEAAVLDTDFGPIKIELYSNVAPKMVARFKELAREGYYNGIAFHRVNQSVIQAGNADTKPGAKPSGVKEGDSGKPSVDAEFSDIKYDAGIVGAARLGNDVNSANSQFFITLKREPGFDDKYTIFGKVIDGMNTVMLISGAPRDGEKPNPDIRIKSVTIQPR
ncbi:MAG TPA: peptidylprolyl isomerase [Pyrinomonadaceae bacterium]|jgi:cyclophilin family peptidyl-prolyl cis-trans isomerase